MTLLPVLAIAATCFQQPEPNQVMKSLHWLAKHQAQDGSWGPSVEGCTCVGALKVPVVERREEIGKKCAPLLKALADHSASVEAREKVVAELVAIGNPAIPFLQDALKDEDAEVRSRAAAIIRRLSVAIDKPEVEASAVALLGFLGAGYTHLSRDTIADICYGTVVKNGLKWLMENRGKSVLAALALTEAYGMTGSAVLKETAEKALQAVIDGQGKDGLWGKSDPVLSAEAVMVLKSAELSDLPFDMAIVDRACESLKAAAEKGTEVDRAAFVLAGIFFKRKKEVGDFAEHLAKYDVKKGTPEATHLVSLAIYQFDGPNGEKWQSWKETLKSEVMGKQVTKGCAAGSFEGEAPLRTTGFNTLALEVFYRYQAVFK